MNANRFTIICAVLSAAALSVAARADDFDDLLASDPSAKSVDTSPTAQDPFPTFDDLGLEPPAGIRFGDRVETTLPAAARDDADQPAANQRQPDQVAEESAPLGIGLVPEPSAVALAALALLYFLVFGRRRTVI